MESGALTSALVFIVWLRCPVAWDRGRSAAECCFLLLLRRDDCPDTSRPVAHSGCANLQPRLAFISAAANYSLPSSYAIGPNTWTLPSFSGALDNRWLKLLCNVRDRPLSTFSAFTTFTTFTTFYDLLRPPRFYNRHDLLRPSRPFTTFYDLHGYTTVMTFTTFYDLHGFTTVTTFYDLHGYTTVTTFTTFYDLHGLTPS
uniref:Secreted protein n=1 Tax=Psilocybe cubensis TaxID=181762 RepID=A0A8H7XX49_PSICU